MGARRLVVVLCSVLIAFAAAVSTVGAAAPKSKFQQAKDRASTAFRTLQSKALNASVLPGASLQQDYADAKDAWDRALDNAVELDPRVIEARRKLARIERKPEDEQGPYERSAAVEALQFVRQRVESDISNEVSDAFARRLESDDDVTAPNRPVGAYKIEAVAYAGGVSTSSFNDRFDTGIFGGRAAIGMQLPWRTKLQFDIEGEKTGAYCSVCEGRSHMITGGHIVWEVVRLLEIGAFGGVQQVTRPSSLDVIANYFIGAEARYTADWWSAGVQLGYIDPDSDRPGLFENAWMLEGRLTMLVGQALRIPGLTNLVLGLSFGYASGKISATSLSAEATQFSATLGYRPVEMPVTFFAGYHNYQNRVEGVGKVWDENIFKGGMKIDFSGVPESPLRGLMPMPYIARATSLKF